MHTVDAAYALGGMVSQRKQNKTKNPCYLFWLSRNLPNHLLCPSPHPWASPISDHHSIPHFPHPWSLLDSSLKYKPLQWNVSSLRSRPWSILFPLLQRQNRAWHIVGSPEIPIYWLTHFLAYHSWPKTHPGPTQSLTPILPGSILDPHQRIRGKMKPRDWGAVFFLVS